MTKEDIKQICQIYDNFRSELDAATIAYNSDDTFWEHILATYNLSQSSLPSNLDEAAKECAIREGYLAGLHHEIMKRVFKAGAEWMAGQFVLVGGEPTGWFRANDGSEYATGLDLKEPIKLPVDFYVRKK